MSNEAVMSQNYAIGEFLHACNEMKCMLAHPSMSKPASLARSLAVGRSVAGRMARFIFMRDTQQSMALPGLLFIVVYVSVMAAI